MTDRHSIESEAHPAPRKSTTEARQAVTLGTMRYVLLLSVGLAAIALVLAYVFF